MQLLIDTQTDGAAALRRIAALLIAEADGLIAAVDTPAQHLHTGPAAPSIALSPPVEVMKADAGHASGAAEDPAKVFAGAQPHVNNSPPPPPPPPAPLNSDAASSSAPPPPAAPPADAPKLDKQGIPWDARIHSETKGLNKSDGNWRNKRGVDKDLLEKVTAELKAQYATAAAPPTVASSSAPAAPPPPAGEQMNLQVPPPPPAAPPPPVSLPPGNGGMGAPPAPPPPGLSTGAGQGGLDFRTLMQRIVAAKKTPDEVRAAAASVGLDGIQAAIGAPDKLPAIAAALGV